MAAIAYQGLAWVSQGRVKEGMALLDEATVAAVAGDMDGIGAAASTCCCLIAACEQVRDYGRAGQWCKRAQEIGERWSHQTLFSFCRIHYAGVLVWQGDWRAAEVELLAAVKALSARPAAASEGWSSWPCCAGGRDATPRRRRSSSGGSPPFRLLAGDLALLARSQIALDRGDPVAAAEFAEQFLRRVAHPGQLVRADALELLAQARLALGDPPAAEAATRDLQSVARDVGTDPLVAAAARAQGWLAAAAGDHDAARRCFEDALAGFERSGARFEAARTRLDLARSLSELERPQPAQEQARASWTALRALGAARDAMHAAAVLGRLTGSTVEGRRHNPAGLTPREMEIVRLAARGLSNQEIAAELVLSVRTVERHLSNIYDKLGTRGRTGRAVLASYARGRAGLRPCVSTHRNATCRPDALPPVRRLASFVGPPDARRELRHPAGPSRDLRRRGPVMTTTANASRLSELARGFAGTIITAADPAYDEARTVWNGAIDKRPAVIAQCATPDDVAAAIRAARDLGLEIAVRGGGHSAAGMGTVHDGMVVDLRWMNAVSVDPAARTAQVGGGATMSHLDRGTEPFGLATTGGRVSTTGVGGFTLNGGTGWLDRAYGLACDNLVAVDLVDGRRRGGHRQRARAPGPVLGAARRRRQLRRGHVVHVPPPRAAAGDGGAAVLAPGGRAGGDPRVPRRHRVRAGSARPPRLFDGAQRLVRDQGHRDGLRDLPQAVDVLAGHGLLDRGDPVRAHPLDRLDGLGGSPGAVRVHPQVDVLPQHPAQQLERVEIALEVVADLDLHLADPEGADHQRERDELPR